VSYRRHPAEDIACEAGEGEPLWDRTPCRPRGLVGVNGATPCHPSVEHAGRGALQRGRPCASASHVGAGHASSATWGPGEAQREALATPRRRHRHLLMGTHVAWRVEERQARCPHTRGNGPGMQAHGSSAGGRDTTHLRLARGQYFVYSNQWC